MDCCEPILSNDKNNRVLSHVSETGRGTPAAVGKSGRDSSKEFHSVKKNVVVSQFYLEAFILRENKSSKKPKNCYL